MRAVEKAKEALQRIADEGAHDTLPGRSLIDGSVIPSQHLVTKAAQIALDALAAIEAEKPSESAGLCAETCIAIWLGPSTNRRNETAFAIQDFVDSELSKEQERAEVLAEFARSIIEWSEAYPAKVFPEPTPAQIDEVCKQVGIRIDGISAMVLREYTKPFGDMARNALTKYQEEGE